MDRPAKLFLTAVGIGAGIMLLKKGKQAITMAGALKELPTYLPILQRVSSETGLPVSLLAAIVWQESAFGLALSPPGPAGTGDGGHGRGLFQIDDRWHQAFIATGKWTDPYEAAMYAATNVLKPSTKFFSSPASAGVTVTQADADRLGTNPGSLRDPRPLTGDALTRAVLAAYNAGDSIVLKALAAGLSPDVPTTGKNYSAHIAERAATVVAELAKSGIAVA